MMFYLQGYIGNSFVLRIIQTFLVVCTDMFDFTVVSLITLFPSFFRGSTYTVLLSDIILTWHIFV